MNKQTHNCTVSTALLILALWITFWPQWLHRSGNRWYSTCTTCTCTIHHKHCVCDWKPTLGQPSYLKFCPNPRDVCSFWANISYFLISLSVTAPRKFHGILEMDPSDLGNGFIFIHHALKTISANINKEFNFHTLTISGLSLYSRSRLISASIDSLMAVLQAYGEKTKKFWKECIIIVRVCLTLWQISVRSAPLNPLVTRARCAKSTSCWYVVRYM